MRKFNSCMAFVWILLVALNANSSDLDEAVNLQKKAFKSERTKNIVAAKASITQDAMKKHNQELFKKFYDEVKKSRIKLINPKIVIEEINTARLRSNYCCEISIQETHDNGMLVVSDGEGIFPSMVLE